MTGVAVDELVRRRALPKRWSADPSALALQDREQVVAALGVVGFTTSGTTGVATTWYRTGTQLVDEARATIAALPHGIDSVITTVEPSTLYGFALGVLVPVILGVPVRREPLLLSGHRLAGAHTLVVSVAPGWRTGTALPTPNGAGEVTFVHAGSMLPTIALDVVAAASRARLVELFGTTEAGLIAARDGGELAWSVVDDVEIFPGGDLPSGEAPLVVASRRIGAVSPGEEPPASIRLGDWVEPVSRREFRFGGRRERIAKPNGRLVDLDALEDRVWAIAPVGIDLACVVVPDSRVGEDVVLLVAGADDDVDVLSRALRRASSELQFVPRVERVAAIDRSAMGKVRLRRL